MYKLYGIITYLIYKVRLASLKTDNVVFAHTRTVKRILDHVKVEGAVNLSHNARNRIYKHGQAGSVVHEPGQHNLYRSDQSLRIKQEQLGPMITQLKDEHDERSRELIQKSGIELILLTYGIVTYRIVY